MSEINPGHPVTDALRGQWFKVLAVVLWKYRDTLPKDVNIGPADFDDIARAFPGMPTVVADERDGALHLSVVSEKEGRELARKEGERG